MQQSIILNIVQKMSKIITNSLVFNTINPWIEELLSRGIGLATPLAGSIDNTEEGIL
jgi:hypothetical protein